MKHASCFDLVIVCGGTGGHVFPAMAVAEEMRLTQPDIRILFIVKKNGFEEKVVADAGFPYRAIRMEGFNRSNMFRNIRLFYIFPMGFLAAFSALRQSGASVVFNTGGYIGVPVLASALLLRKGITLLALDTYPGVTVRFFARFARVVFLAYQEAKRYLPGVSNTLAAGNPLRRTTGGKEIDLRKEYGLTDSEKVVFVFGGSQGARGINRAILSFAKQLTEEQRITLLWQTGKPDFEEIKRSVSGLNKVRVFPFIENIYDFYRAADLAVCRAGAMTVSELAKFGLPAAFVPLPTAAEDHQTVNARMVETNGAGVCVPQNEAMTTLYGIITGLLANEASLKVMRTKMKSLHREDAAQRITQRLLEEMKHD